MKDPSKGGKRRIAPPSTQVREIDRRKFLRYKQPVTPKEAVEIFDKTAKERIKNFTLDENNEEALMQMISYFYGDSNFKGDLKKGLFIVGNVGSGKTEAFNIFKKWISVSGFDKLPHTLDFNIAHCKRIFSEFSDEEKGGITSLKKYLSTKAWVFNDLGKEIESGNLASHYGIKLNVMEYIIDERYILFKDFGIVTHVTSNYPIEGRSGKRYFKDFYGDYIDDRMNEMFNTIVFKGNSRRK